MTRSRARTRPTACARARVHVKPHGERVLSLTKVHPEQAEANHIARASALTIARAHAFVGARVNT